MVANRRIFGIPVLLLALAMVFVCCSEAKKKYHGNIEGYVTDSETEEAISDAYVLAKSLKDGSKQDTHTNSEGYYRFEDCEFGLNELEVSSEFYYSEKRYADVKKDQDVRVDIELEPMPDEIDCSATVFVGDAADEEPIEDARVELYSGFKQSEWTYVDTKHTKDNGEVFWDLDTVHRDEIKPYGVIVTKDGYAAATDAFTIRFDKPDVRIKVYLIRQ